MSTVEFAFKDGDEIFAAEVMTHLLQRGTEPIVGAAMAAAMEFFLSTTLSKVRRENAVDIVEDNKLKHNKFIPGVRIAIKNKSQIKNKNNVLLVLAWNFYNDIKKNNKDLSDNFINVKELESSN